MNNKIIFLAFLILLFTVFAVIVGKSILGKKKDISKNQPFENFLKKHEGEIFNSTERTLFVKLTSRLNSNIFDKLYVLPSGGKETIKLFEGSHFVVVLNTDNISLWLTPIGKSIFKIPIHDYHRKVGKINVSNKKSIQKFSDYLNANVLLKFNIYPNKYWKLKITKKSIIYDSSALDTNIGKSP